MRERKFNPVKSDSRTCFGIEWFETEEEAEAFAKAIQKRGDRYNGGWCHGTACGRDYGFDHVDKETSKKLYAVTTA
jgi:hypothetical protein|tara:strand:+ start:25463 stop:25690 length:228 start_codon:yes stop_codon:yes gene_type:complete